MVHFSQVTRVKPGLFKEFHHFLNFMLFWLSVSGHNKDVTVAEGTYDGIATGNCSYWVLFINVDHFVIYLKELPSKQNGIYVSRSNELSLKVSYDQLLILYTFILNVDYPWLVA